MLEQNQASSAAAPFSSSFVEGFPTAPDLSPSQRLGVSSEWPTSAERKALPFQGSASVQRLEPHPASEASLVSVKCRKRLETEPLSEELPERPFLSEEEDFLLHQTHPKPEGKSSTPPSEMMTKRGNLGDEGELTTVMILERLLALLEGGYFDLPEKRSRTLEAEGAAPCSRVSEEREGPINTAVLPTSSDSEGLRESSAFPSESNSSERPSFTSEDESAEASGEGREPLKLSQGSSESETETQREEKTQLPRGDGRSSSVQGVFPDVSLPGDESEAHVQDGVFPPPLDIFGPLPSDDEHDDTMELAERQAETIVDTLQNFGVKASVAHIVVGPSVVQFQIELAPGIKVSKVAGLANDLTMALAVISVRVEAPILGQRYVGIEIPNPIRRGVALRSIMESEEFTAGDFLLPLPMGMRVDSRFLICGLEDMPHLLVAGTTGSGKSVFVNSCILGMCSCRTPDELRLILVDPKHVEFAIYEGLPHLLACPISDSKKAVAALTWTVQEMERRTECFAETRVRNLASYNERVLPKDRLPNIVVVVDELADLMYTAGKEVESLIARLAQKARAAGIHLILATQRPSVDVITGLIKANVPARVAFAVPSQTDSRTIIDTGGAEKLLGKGDMLFYSTRYPRPLRLQAPFITEERTLDFVRYAKNVFGVPDYLEFEDVSGGEEGGRSGGGALDDPKIEEALRLVMDTGVASASGLQRYLNIGYPRAGRLVTGLEQLGILGPLSSNTSKPREILMDEESAFEALERARGEGLYDG
ncbi:MAG: DNA translocase FtsK [Fretibacterium sp.]|nr:DNA translocase FtsK [Fretibacterium sp.]